MKTAVHTGPKEITLEERPLPEPGQNEYRVRIKACAICGSDVWWPKEVVENEPIHGHEACGVVEACGAGADKAYLYVRHPSATNQAFENTRDGASICAFVGMEGAFHLPEWLERELIWSFYFLPEEYEENIQSVRSAETDIAKVISHRIPLEEINEAFRLRFECQDESSKIVITMED